MKFVCSAGAVGAVVRQPRQKGEGESALVGVGGRKLAHVIQNQIRLQFVPDAVVLTGEKGKREFYDQRDLLEKREFHHQRDSLEKKEK